MESLRPNPVNIRAVQPVIPIMVVRTLLLYRKIFLMVILLENFNLFQIKVMCSRRIFLPILGALGRIRLAGTSFKFLIQTKIAVPQIQIIQINSPIILADVSISQINFGMVNIVL